MSSRHEAKLKMNKREPAARQGFRGFERAKPFIARAGFAGPRSQKGYCEI